MQQRHISEPLFVVQFHGIVANGQHHVGVVNSFCHNIAEGVKHHTHVGSMIFTYKTLGHGREHDGQALTVDEVL